MVSMVDSYMIQMFHNLVEKGSDNSSKDSYHNEEDVVKHVVVSAKVSCCLLELDSGTASNVKPSPIPWNTGNEMTSRIAKLWVNGLNQDPDGSKPDGPNVYRMSHGKTLPDAWPEVNPEDDIGYYFYCLSGTRRVRSSSPLCPPRHR